MEALEHSHKRARSRWRTHGELLDLQAGVPARLSFGWRLRFVQAASGVGAIMKSFVTGSRAYGTPRADSDIDLVVLVDGPDCQMLCDMAAAQNDLGSPGGEHYEDGRALRFGNLNLLCITNPNHFDVWRRGTDELKAMAPVTREKAVEHISEIRRQNKISGWG